MVESLTYETVREIGEVELRRYKPTVLATVSGLDDDDAFMILFRYISGNNRSRQSIAMTTPVISPAGGPEKIPMTAPVISRDNSFSFAMPENLTLDKVPTPTDERVKIEEVPARTLGVLRFRGRAGMESVERMSARLLTSLESAGLTTNGEVVLMRYNSPFMPGLLRRNEVAVEVTTR